MFFSLTGRRLGVLVVEKQAMLIRAIHQVGDAAAGVMDRGHVDEQLCLRVTLERKVLGALDTLVLELAKGMVEVGEHVDQPIAHQSLQVLLHALHLHHDV
jgi:hypothetical protein